MISFRSHCDCDTTLTSLGVLRLVEWVSLVLFGELIGLELDVLDDMVCCLLVID